MRCERHGLALTPDGQCLVCAREEREAEGKLPGWFVGVAIVVIAGLLTAGLLRLGLQRIEARKDERATAHSEPAAKGAQAPDRPRVAPPEPDTAEWRATLERELPEERKRVAITVYSATWCGPCHQAMAWLDARGIPYFSADVDTTPGAADNLRRLNPRGSIPTINVEGEVLVGFNPSALDRAITTAARRNLAIRLLGKAP